jgi:hypothetical protein
MTNQFILQNQEKDKGYNTLQKQHENGIHHLSSDHTVLTQIHQHYTKHSLSPITPSNMGTLESKGKSYQQPGELVGWSEFWQQHQQHQHFQA